MNQDFLGRGLKFPFCFSRRTGGAEMSTSTSRDHQHIHESIRQILGTRVGERFMRPEFGSNLHKLVFEQNAEILKGLILYHVIDALKKWERRIVITTVDFDDSAFNKDHHILPVILNYRLINSQVSGNLVWQFYREI